MVVPTARELQQVLYPFAVPVAYLVLFFSSGILLFLGLMTSSLRRVQHTTSVWVGAAAGGVSFALVLLMCVGVFRAMDGVMIGGLVQRALAEDGVYLHRAGAGTKVAAPVLAALTVVFYGLLGGTYARRSKYGENWLGSWATNWVMG